MTARVERLKVALAQLTITSNEPLSNLSKVRQIVGSYSSKVDLIVFPETITTAFSTEAYDYADDWESGVVYQNLRVLAQEYAVALAGSYLVKVGEETYNRFFLFDEMGVVQYQDKRHLFRLGGEAESVLPTRERKVFQFKGWRILPLVCYDLRFPVWARNVKNEYDLLLCVANWPDSRRLVWQTLLRARAIENMSYAIGVNRVGEDYLGLKYAGDSVLVSPYGNEEACQEYSEEVLLVELDYSNLTKLRSKFPVWQDADEFEMKL